MQQMEFDLTNPPQKAPEEELMGEVLPLRAGGSYGRLRVVGASLFAHAVWYGATRNFRKRVLSPIRTSRPSFILPHAFWARLRAMSRKF
jgi:hypothetical protein